jgi:hypothetical protein
MSFERPFRIGPVSLAVPKGDSVEATYGPKPDEVTQRDGALHVGYSDFRDHVVLYVKDIRTA